jgi:hypothetical protein
MYTQEHESTRVTLDDCFGMFMLYCIGRTSEQNQLNAVSGEVL